MAKQAEKPSPLPYLALLLASAVPGAGHMYLGRVRRGVIIFITIGALFWSGVAIGGVLTVDSVRERWWFVAEMLTGVHGLIGWHRQRKVYDKVLANERLDLRDPHDQAVLDARLQAEGVALVTPADTAARAYAGVAGLLNLMCIFDALMLSIMGVRGEPPPQADKPKQEAKAPKK
ncbi:MAG: DUF6677 family protein [Phycisphaerae bacterium]